MTEIIIERKDLLISRVATLQVRTKKYVKHSLLYNASQKLENCGPGMRKKSEELINDFNITQTVRF